jgi:glutamate--cysteine ligase
MLERDDGKRVGLADWGQKLLQQCQPIAAALDAAHPQAAGAYGQALTLAGERLADPSLTPSARVLAQLRQSTPSSCVDFALEKSFRHREFLLQEALPDSVMARYAQIAAESVAAQREAEAGDILSFEAYRLQYLSQPLMDLPLQDRKAV